jgi:hypothetical protein
VLGIIIYIGLFTWGMSADRFTAKHTLGILAVFVVQCAVSYGLFGAELIRTGAMSIGGFMAALGIDLAIDIGVFFAGYGVGRYRRGKTQKADDVIDTFS